MQARNQAVTPLLEAVLPHYDISQRQALLVEHPAAEVFMALQNYNPQTDWRMRGLLWLHDLPARILTGGAPGAASMSTLGRLGDHAMAAQAPTGHAGGALLLGFAGKFWLPFLPVARPSLSSFKAWERARTTKVVWQFAATSVTAHTTELTCVLRAQSFGAVAKRAFGSYWRLVQAPSGAFRLWMLRGIGASSEARS